MPEVLQRNERIYNELVCGESVSKFLTTIVAMQPIDKEGKINLNYWPEKDQ